MKYTTYLIYLQKSYEIDTFCFIILYYVNSIFVKCKSTADRKLFGCSYQIVIDSKVTLAHSKSEKIGWQAKYNLF